MTFGALAIVCLAALVGPLVSVSRLTRVPVVIGELVVGIAIGATGLRLVSASQPEFAFLAEIGFALVMFVAGTHVPVRDPALRAGLRVGAARAALVGLVAVPAGLGIAAWFGTGHGPLYAVILASSSAALILPAMGGAGEQPAGYPAMVAQVAIADTACIVLLPLVIDTAHVARAAVGAAAVAAAAAAMWAALRALESSGLRRRVHRVSEDRLLAIELRTSLVLLFALAALAVWLHVSVMLAGFALGLAVAAVGPPRRLAKQLFALTEGFFGPVFFVWLGASLDLRALADHPRALALGMALGVAAVVVHGAMALTRQPLPLAVITAAQLGVPIAAATMGMRAGVLRPSEDTALLLGALVTVVAVAIAARRVGAAADGDADATGSVGASPPPVR